MLLPAHGPKHADAQVRRFSSESFSIDRRNDGDDDVRVSGDHGPLGQSLLSRHGFGIMNKK